MNYQEALEYIHNTYKFGSKLGLENINYLLDLMGNPHKDLKVIHVAGTNGKGSTSAYIHSVLVEQGYKVGLYTSPYLEEFTERIRVNGENISKEELAKITFFAKTKVDEMLAHGKNHPTEFEIVTAIGFEYFRRQEVDYLVLEVGLGGRGDSTNVMDRPLLSVITPIDFDHMEYLGSTLDKIAYEKAGIIKERCPVVVSHQKKEALQVITEVCEMKNSSLTVAPLETIEIIEYTDEGQCFHVQYGDEKLEDIRISMLGEHQIQNATVALTAIGLLESKHGIEISKTAIYEGMKKAMWPGRIEVVRRNPTVIIDGAHNAHGMKSLVKTLKRLYDGKRMILAMGILGDKDIQGMLDEIVPLADKIVLTKPNNPRALKLDKFAEMIKNYNKPFVPLEDIPEAVKEALCIAGEEDIVVFCGSLYMIGAVRTILREL